MNASELLITGIPGSSKSTFCRWLRDNHGFAFVNMESEPSSSESLDAANLRFAWEAGLACGDLGEFVEGVRSKAPIVLEWGFPVGSSKIVFALIHAGIEGWWFDGDRLTARERFVERNTVPVISFDLQYQNISGNWSLIEKMFRNRVIKAAQSDGSILPPEKIFQIIKGT